MTFGNNNRYLTFGNGCNGMTFGNNNHDMTFGNDCERLTFGNYCYWMTFGNGCWYLTFRERISLPVTVLYVQNHCCQSIMRLWFSNEWKNICLLSHYICNNRQMSSQFMQRQRVSKQPNSRQNLCLPSGCNSFLFRKEQLLFYCQKDLFL